MNIKVIDESYGRTVTFATLHSLVEDYAALIDFLNGLMPEMKMGEQISQENLHHNDGREISYFANQLLAAVNKIRGRKYEIERMWCVKNTGPSEVASINYHNHLCSLSAVFYVDVPENLIYPEGSISILTPDVINIQPVKGLLILFDHSVFHDAIPMSRSHGTRLSIAADFAVL